MNGIKSNGERGYVRAWHVLFSVLVGIVLVFGTQMSSFAQNELDPARRGFDDRVADREGLPTDNGVLGDLGRPAQESLVTWMIRSSGVFGFLIMLVLFVLVALVMMLATQLRRDNYLPTSFIEQFEQRLQAKDYQGAYETAKSSDSFAGRVLASGMGRLPRGLEEAEAGMQEVGDDETMAMEQKIGYLALIGSIAPMLGLLGTVQGMVLAFQVIATSSTAPKPSDLADGIATALFTTLEGLVVCIPAMIFHTVFKNRLSRFMMECGFVVTNLMKSFQSLGKTTASIRSMGGGSPASVPATPQDS